jgi:MerR family transcriptional regulator, thiopeptide resistance regulator
MEGHTVRRLARLAGVSVRTLHHYDAIGLLKPGRRSPSGYRLYGQADLLRLQQILFYRELDLPLPEIARILDDPDFDPAESLRSHRKALEAKLGRLHRLLRTLDETLAHYSGGPMLTDAELYQGFPPDRVESIRKEARERYGEEKVADSERRAQAMGRERWAQVQGEAEAINRDLAALLAAGSDPGAAEARAVVARHLAWIGNFWSPDAESYRGLGRLYVEHPEFRAYYEKAAPGLADFLSRAIERFCDDFPAA